MKPIKPREFKLGPEPPKSVNKWIKEKEIEFVFNSGRKSLEEDSEYFESTHLSSFIKYLSDKVDTIDFNCVIIDWDNSIILYRPPDEQIRNPCYDEYLKDVDNYKKKLAAWEEKEKTFQELIKNPEVRRAFEILQPC